MDELADIQMQEGWNAWRGEDHQLVRAEECGGVAPPLLNIDELCPVGSSFRRELVACLAQMFREAERASVHDGEVRSGSCDGAGETSDQRFTLREEQLPTQSNGSRRMLEEACLPTVDQGSSVSSSVLDEA